MVEGILARVSGRMGEAALRLRRPARRVCGSVRSATATGAIIVGAFCLTMGSMISDGSWWYRQVNGLVITSGSFAIITGIMDIVLIFGVLIKDDKTLKYILCATMAVYTICAPLSVCSFIGVAICGYWTIPLWEVFRLGSCLLHLGVMYCLLAELRGDLPPEGALGAPGAAPAEGWLKNNLARQGPPPPAGDETLLKVHVERGAAPVSAPAPAPAVLAPSSCTTAAPVHHPPAPVSGPPSSSDA